MVFTLKHCLDRKNRKINYKHSSIRVEYSDEIAVKVSGEDKNSNIYLDGLAFVIGVGIISKVSIIYVFRNLLVFMKRAVPQFDFPGSNLAFSPEIFFSDLHGPLPVGRRRNRGLQTDRKHDLG